MLGVPQFAPVAGGGWVIPEGEHLLGVQRPDLRQRKVAGKKPAFHLAAWQGNCPPAGHQMLDGVSI